MIMEDIVRSLEGKASSEAHGWFKFCHQGPESAITRVPEWSANGPSVPSQLLACPW